MIKMNCIKLSLYQVFVIFVLQAALTEGDPVLVGIEVDPSDDKEDQSMPVVTRSSTPIDPQEAFRRECLDRHNVLRNAHMSQNLTRSKMLEQRAQNWANVLLRKRQVKRNPYEYYGENAGYRYTTEHRRITGDEMCNEWYKQIDNYDFSNPGHSKNGKKITHFSQVVWADSREIGIGVADDGEGTYFAVALYNPPGNFRKKFAKNVKRPRVAVKF